jgi:hypothetical protein
LAREERERHYKEDIQLAVEAIKAGDGEAYMLIREAFLDTLAGWLPPKLWESEDYFDINGDIRTLIYLLVGKEI